jgi:hypothetical protein
VSHPFEEDRCQRSRDLANLGVRRVNAQVFGVKSRETRGHEEAKWREARSRPSEGDRWRRLRDLTNSGVRRVNAQVLGVQSHEDARSEKVITVGSRSREDHWIRMWDRASEPHEKRLENLATKIVKLRGNEVASFGISDIGSRRRSYSTS